MIKQLILLIIIKYNRFIPVLISNRNKSKKFKTIDDVFKKNGLVRRLVKYILENILKSKMNEHVGRNKYERQTVINSEDRNGYSQKSFGDVDVNIPCDKKSKVEPK